MISIYTLAIIFSTFFLLIILELIRKNKLSERYSLIWILFGIIMLVLSSSPVFIEKISSLIAIKYAPSLLFILGLFFLIAYSLQMTMVISQQAKKIIRLTQEISILRDNIDSSKNE